MFKRYLCISDTNIMLFLIGCSRKLALLVFINKEKEKLTISGSYNTQGLQTATTPFAAPECFCREMFDAITSPP